METTLHRQLKQLYADGSEQFEMRVGRFRIDVISRGRLVEIQQGGLAAIREKVSQLLAAHQVVIVKPIVQQRQLVKRSRKHGRVLSRRLSPKRGSIVQLFDDLVHFTRIFPHPQLSLEVPMLAVEEWRFPGHGRRRYRRPRDHQVEDQKLLAVLDVYRFQTAADLAKLIPRELPSPFDTAHLARAMNVDRWMAQRIAYCLRETGAIQKVGKQANCLLYEFPGRKPSAATNKRLA